MKEKKVLVLISESFPYGRAYASRTRALVRLFRQAGCEVTVLCDRKSAENGYAVPCRVEEVSDKPARGLRKLLLVWAYRKKVETLLKEEKYDLVVARSMYDRHPAVMKTVKKAGVPFLLESCERYDARTFPKGEKDFRYRQFVRCWEKSYPKADGVIAISRYLQRFYEEKGLPTVRVPAVLETDLVPFHTQAAEKSDIRLIYSGDVTGGKEEMNDIFLALERVEGFSFHLYGPSKEQVLRELSAEAAEALSRLGERVVIHGRIPQNEMQDAILSADFGIFIRPKRLSSEAGFPTKLGEYLAAGLPVIVNDTGDISLVLKDGENGFTAEPKSADKLEEIFRKIAGMSREELTVMKQNARTAAERWLDPSAYVGDVERFFEKFG